MARNYKTAGQKFWSVIGYILLSLLVIASIGVILYYTIPEVQGALDTAWNWTVDLFTKTKDTAVEVTPVEQVDIWKY